MSDFDPDAYLSQSSAAAFDPDVYLSSPPSPEAAPAPRSAVVRRNPTMGAIDTPSASVGDLTQAAASGVNSGALDLAGLPMDTATNASNLVKSAVGYPYSKITGQPVPKWLEADDPANVPGTSEWLKRQARKVDPNLIDAAPNAAGQNLSALHTAGEAAGPIPVAGALGRAGELRIPSSTVPGIPDLATSPSAPTAQSILDAQANNSSQSMGAAAAASNLRSTSPEFQNAVVRGARQNGGALNPQAISRHIDAETLPVPMRLTEGQALQDPGLISNEQNMRGRHQELRDRFDEQNKALSANITALRDRVGPDVFSTNPVEHGDTFIDAYQQKDAPIKADITAKYKALEDANGGQFPLDTNGFVKSTDAALSKALKSNSVPSDLNATLNEFRNGRQMNFEDFESLRSDAADAARTSTDGRQRAAAGIIRDQLESMPLTPEAAKLKPLADAARSAARARFQALDADPAYDAAVHGTVPPDRFVQRFMTGPQATRDGVATIKENLKDNPVAVQTMGVAALDHLRQAAGIDSMGNGNFSQSGFNKTAQALGPRLNSLVDPHTSESLDALGNVARYTQFQPRGSFVNNSNTFVSAAAEHAKGAIEGAVNLKAGGIPVGSWVRNHFQSAAEKRAVQRSLEPGAGITRLQEAIPGPTP